MAVAGDAVVVGALLEDSAATGVDGDQSSDAAPHSGAAYLFRRDGTTWTQQAYLKASNTEADDEFGRAVAIASDAVIVAARGEDSVATGVNGDQSSNAAEFSGAAYVYGLPSSLLGDLNGDGHVDAVDLGFFLGTWGAAGGPSDLDGNGAVGAADLAILLGLWTG